MPLNVGRSMSWSTPAPRMQVRDTMNIFRKAPGSRYRMPAKRPHRGAGHKEEGRGLKAMSEAEQFIEDGRGIDENSPQVDPFSDHKQEQQHAPL